MKNIAGYTQHQLNYIKDYSKILNEEAIKLEFIWQGVRSETLKIPDGMTIDKIIKNQVTEMERYIRYMKNHLIPLEDDEIREESENEI